MDRIDDQAKEVVVFEIVGDAQRRVEDATAFVLVQPGNGVRFLFRFNRSVLKQNCVLGQRTRLVELCRNYRSSAFRCSIKRPFS